MRTGGDHNLFVPTHLFLFCRQIALIRFHLIHLDTFCSNFYVYWMSKSVAENLHQLFFVWPPVSLSGNYLILLTVYFTSSNGEELTVSLSSRFKREACYVRSFDILKTKWKSFVYYVMKYKSTGSLVATFLGTNNLRHPYNSIVYCGSSFLYSIQTVNGINKILHLNLYMWVSKDQSNVIHYLELYIEKRRLLMLGFLVFEKFCLFEIEIKVTEKKTTSSLDTSKWKLRQSLMSFSAFHVLTCSLPAP